MTPKSKDEYDDAIAYLTANPSDIMNAWHNPSDVEGGCLFRYTSGERSGTYWGGTRPACGCLTQVASGAFPSPNVQLTLEIRKDSRIPHMPEDITVDDLPVFAEWQRKLDAMREAGEL